MAEREILGDAIRIGGVDHGGLAEAAAALRVFGVGQVAAAGGKTHGLAGGSDLEPLGHGFFRFDAFGTSHKLNSIAKERGIYPTPSLEASTIFGKGDTRNHGPPAPVIGGGEVKGLSSLEGAVASIGAPAFSCLSTWSVTSISPLL